MSTRMCFCLLKIDWNCCWVEDWPSCLVWACVGVGISLSRRVTVYNTFTIFKKKHILHVHTFAWFHLFSSLESLFHQGIKLRSFWRILLIRKTWLNTELSNQNCKMQTKPFGKECNSKRTSKSMPLAEHKLKKRREAESSLVAAQEGLWCWSGMI